MSGRRSHPRFAVTNPWGGVIRILRDVVVNRADRDELLAVSNAAAIVGETLSLDLIGGGHALAVKVRVMDSRPVIIDGSVRHRVRLSVVEAQSETRLAQAPVSTHSAVEAVTRRVAEVG